MFVVFGWLMETRPVKPLLQCYSYVCQRGTSWELWRETEWVTLFRMRTLPFLSRDSLACRPRCSAISCARRAARARRSPERSASPIRGIIGPCF